MKKIAALIGIVVVVVGAIGGAFAWYYFNGPCGVTLVKDADAALVDKSQEYNDAYKIAVSTSRISLAGPVSELQKIQRETDKVEVPVCLETAKSELVTSINTSVDGFLAFMSQEADATVSDHMKKSVDHLENFKDELLRVRKCTPFCK